MALLNKMIWRLLTLVITFTLLLTSLAWANEERDKGYYTIVSEQNKVLLKTALRISVGDSFIDENNDEYEVIKIKGDKATAKLSKNGKKASRMLWFNQALAAEMRNFGGVVTTQGETSRPIGIYHTHSDESYIPSEGTFSVSGRGGIYKVGAAMAGKYRELGANVEHNQNIHNPHDGMAYDRSRRTVVQMLKNRPITLFDVHRDAAPADAYRRVINGQTVSQTLFVIGNQNPNYQANLTYARQLKDSANSKYPGLAKGILVTGGKFNQDLTPRDVLLEMGAHTNSRESAERGAALFADATKHAIVGRTTTAAGRPAAPNPQQAAERNNAAGTSIIWWILGLAIIGGGFLLINEGSMEGIKARFRHFTNAEFTNFLGLKKKDQKDKNREDQDKLK